MELALALPVLVTMLLVLVNLGFLVTDKVVVAYAARQGARLAAELGSGQASGLNEAQIGQNVCQAVAASTDGLVYVTSTIVDIYRADAAGAPADGSFSASDPYDQYATSDCGTSLHLGFPTGTRNQVPPTETSIGVNVQWRYATPAGDQAVSVTLNDYTVLKASPLLG